MNDRCILHVIFRMCGLFRRSLPAVLLSAALCLPALLTTAFAADRSLPAGRSASSVTGFVANAGQWNDEVLFRAGIHGGAFFAGRSGFTVAMADPAALAAFAEAKLDCKLPVCPVMTAAAYRVSFVNASAGVKVAGFEREPYHHNYFLGDDPRAWRSGVPVYHTVSYQGLYNGIDMSLYLQDAGMEYVFYVAPYADPGAICWQYEGVRGVSLTGGCLVVTTAVSRVVEMRPVAWQLGPEGDTLPVECRFALKGGMASFELGSYDRGRPLVIDPLLVFSSYSGSTADNWGYTATYDADGNLYGGGIAFDVGYPVTTGAYQVDYCSGHDGVSTDVVLSKFDSGGAFLQYSTYMGGSWVDIPHSLFVNGNGELYVFGTTGSADFPVTPGAFGPVFGGGPAVTLSSSLYFPNGTDLFVSKFSADGSRLSGSTFVGGGGNDGINTAAGLRKNYADDNRGEILLDGGSNVYVVTSTLSSDFPVTPFAYSPTAAPRQNVCVFKLDYSLSQMIWGTYFGGGGDDAGYGMMLSGDGSVYICGGTCSADLPAGAASWQPVFGGAADGFVAHLSADGACLSGCTYAGSEVYDQAYLIKGDSRGYPHIFGQTAAAGSHWIADAAYNMPGGGQFLAKLTPDLDSAVWSTAFGTGRGGPDISPTALLVDYCSNIYMSGWGSKTLNGFGGTDGLPVTADAFQTTTDGSDYYFICLGDNASQLVFATYFGGDHAYAREHVDGGTSRFDRKGCIYQAVCAGCGGQSTFPATPGAYSTENGSSNCNLAVVKIDFGLPVAVADFTMPNTICAPAVIQFANRSRTAGEHAVYFWDFGDGDTSTEENPAHQYEHEGVYTVMLAVTDTGSCNYSDTLRKRLLVLSNSTVTLPALSVCCGDFVQIGVAPDTAADYRWLSGPPLDDVHISNPVVAPEASVTYRLSVNAGGCADTLEQRVEVYYVGGHVSGDTTVCYGDTAHLQVFPDSGSMHTSVEWSLSPDFTDPFNVGGLCMDAVPAAATVYYVRLSGHGCTSVSKATVSVDRLEIIRSPDVPVCFGDSAVLRVEHNGGAGCRYHWSVDGVGEFSDENPVVLPSSAAAYSVTVTDMQGCSAAAEGTVVIQGGTFDPPLDVWCDTCTVWQYQTAMVHATDYGSDYAYSWSPAGTVSHPESPSTWVSPPESMYYTVAVTDTFGCMMSGSVFITVDSIVCGEPFVFVPSAFSPNGDGRNDVLYVRSGVLSDFRLVVYSHWGEKVFETDNLADGWDGTFKSRPCQQDVYDYLLTGHCLNGERIAIKGNVTLLR